MAIKAKLMRVGELAKAVGKTVRAMHLYEELGLLQPQTRSSGGFRLYHPDAVERLQWIIKLQAIGFTLGEIKDFNQSFEDAPTARDAAAGASSVFQSRLADIRKQIAELRVVENDLEEALDYLASCQGCSTLEGPSECVACDQQGHERGDVPPLFAGLASPPVPNESTIDVAVTELRKEGSRHGR